MNVHDSERLLGLMAQEGYAPTDVPDDADLIVINSCSVRDKAEHKLLSAAGLMKRFKRRRSDVIVALAGCVAQQEGQKLLDRAPHVDIVFGPDHIGRFPELVERVREAPGTRLAETEFFDRNGFTFPPLHAVETKVSAYVSVMKGCDKFCSFCVVPMTRGREVSRSHIEILEEVHTLVAAGAREIILLGQTVNSYGKKRTGGQIPFSELLLRVSEVVGVERIRFTSPHPADFTPDQIEAFRTIPKLCPHMHLPVQSGSTRVLSAMRRGYSRDQYLEVVDAFRSAVPEAALTTDIIVGFPTETESEFEETLTLLDRVQYTSAFSFAYSERPGTKALDLTPSVPEPERISRLHRLQDKQDSITKQHLVAMRGRTYPVLIEGPSKTDPTRSSGRTPHNRVVHVDGLFEPATIALVEILEAFNHSARGRVVES